MKKIKLGSKGYALVDDNDFDWLIKSRWYLDNHGYVYREIWSGGKRKYEKMARVIVSAPKGTITDHINGNKLDNKRSNLRIVNWAQSNQNRHFPSFNKSGIKGVHWDFYNKKWLAQIQVNKKKINLGRYKKQEDAVITYRKAALRYFGEYMRI